MNDELKKNLASGTDDSSSVKGDEFVGVIADIKKILFTARQQSYSAVNFVMVRAYWLVGRRIVINEQEGEKRADYGKRLISRLAKEISRDFDKNMSARRIREIRQFYLTFPFENLWHPVSAESAPEKWHSVSAEFENELQSALFTKLSWTHIRHLLRVTDPEAREWYIKESVSNVWSVRTLDRNISTQYFQRLLASQVKAPVVQEMEEKSANHQKNKLEFIKNPAMLEFLNIPRQASLTESKIESAIIDNLHHFLLELGKGFAFVERQKLIRTEVRDYFIDLVFYNFILKCFVLIDLKTERITHQDVGQMDMYVRMYDETIKSDDDNPTVGIVLCSETDQDIARYSILKGNEHIFSSRYKLYLPTEEELAAEIEREKEIIRLQLEAGDEP
jgi:predicted nuclease of restriction endonuclease-like (RecB) superfamily